MGLLSRVDGIFGQLDALYFALNWRLGKRPVPLFHRGWGSQEAIEAVNSAWDDGWEPPPAAIRWETGWVARGSVAMRSGKFSTPRFAGFLPQQSHVAFVHQVAPTHGRAKPAVVLVPTSREAGIERRLHVASALARQGITTLLLESPFMGRRAPAHQVGTTLSHLSDFFLLCGATIFESSVLVRWLAQAGHEHVTIAGISQGGYIALATARHAGNTTGAVALVPPHSGTPVLLEGLIGRLCDWDALARTSGHHGHVKRRVAELFARTSLETLPPPAEVLTVIGGLRDRYVPPNSIERLQHAWGKRLTVRWLPGGHVSSIAESRHLITALLRTCWPEGPSHIESPASFRPRPV